MVLNFMKNQYSVLDESINEERVVRKIQRVIEEQSLAQWDLTESLLTEIIPDNSNAKNENK